MAEARDCASVNTREYHVERQTRQVGSSLVGRSAGAQAAGGWSVYDIVGLKLHEGCQRKSCSEGQLESWILAESRQHA